jgi:hypothetical protein
MAAESERHAEILIARLAASRAALAKGAVVLRHRVDVPARMKDSLLSRPLLWFGGSLVTGLLASRLFRGRKPAGPPAPVARRGLLSLALGGAFTLARPALQSWALREFRKRFVIPGNDNVRSS